MTSVSLCDGGELPHESDEEHETGTADSLGATDKVLGLIGAWSDLDRGEMVEALARIRHQTLPAPPIEDGEPSSG